MGVKVIVKYKIISICKILLFTSILICDAYSVYANEKLIMVTGNPPTTSQGRLLIKIYSEVFRRLELEWEYKVLPGNRRSLLLDNGDVDGELSRVLSYGDDHPDLVRVEESPFSITHSAFTFDPKIRLNGIQDLNQSNYRISYKRGAHKPAEIISRLIMSDLVEEENVGIINEYIHGLRMLQYERIDLLIANSFAIRDLLQTEEFIDNSIREVMLLSESPIYAYMHKRHAGLAVKIGSVLKEMKDEGFIEIYLKNLIDNEE